MLTWIRATETVILQFWQTYAWNSLRQTNAFGFCQMKRLSWNGRLAYNALTGVSMVAAQPGEALSVR